MTDDATVDERIARARARLAANLGELQQRVTRARELISPQTYLRSPWLKVGVAATIGYLAIGPRRQRRLVSGDAAAAPAAQPSLLGEVVRATVVALAGALVTHLLRPRRR